MEAFFSDMTIRSFMSHIARQVWWFCGSLTVFRRVESAAARAPSHMEIRHAARNKWGCLRQVTLGNQTGPGKIWENHNCWFQRRQNQLQMGLHTQYNYWKGRRMKEARGHHRVLQSQIWIVPIQCSFLMFAIIQHPSHVYIAFRIPLAGVSAP